MKQYEQNNQTPNTIYFGKWSMSNFSEYVESTKDTIGLKTPPPNSNAQ